MVLHSYVPFNEGRYHRIKGFINKKQGASFGTPCYKGMVILLNFKIQTYLSHCYGYLVVQENIH